MTKPLITAAVTSYNAQDTIVAALESAVAQDWPNLEVVIVDDASTDDTVALIESFMLARKGKNPPIHLIKRRRNGGVAKARNKLIEEAKGVFIAFFDDDDISRPDRLSKQYARLAVCEKASGTNLAVCHTAREQVFPDGSRRYEGTMGTKGPPFPGDGKVADRILLGRLTRDVAGSCATCAQMARKSVYKRLRGFDSNLRRSEDTDFNLRLARRGGFFVGLAEPLVVQTMTVGAEKQLMANEKAYKALFLKHRDYLDRRGWYRFCCKWQVVRYAWLRHKKTEFRKQLAALFLRNPVKVLLKIVWSLPALSTQRAYRRQHGSE